MDAKSKLHLLNKISNDLNKNLTYDDIENIITNVENNIPKPQLHNDNKKSNNKGNNKKSNDNYEQYDPKELMKLDIGVAEEDGQQKNTNHRTQNTNVDIENIMELSTQDDLIKLINPSAGYASRILVLDSLYQDDTMNGSGKIAWDIIPSRDLNNMNQSGTIGGNTLSGANSTEPLKNIVGIRLMPFRLLMVDINNSYNYRYNTDPLFLWTILIEELDIQSIIGPTGRKYHFMAAVEELTNQITLKNGRSSSYAKFWEMTTHNYNQGYYWFRQPITELTRMTLSFGCPWYQFNIKNSKFPVTINKYNISGTDYLAAYINTTLTWNNVNQGNLAGNLRITGFTTANPVTDAVLIAYVNSTTFTTSMYSDYIVTISSVDYNVIAFTTVNLTRITINANSGMNIYTDVYRMIFPFEIIYQNNPRKIYN